MSPFSSSSFPFFFFFFKYEGKICNYCFGAIQPVEKSCPAGAIRAKPLGSPLGTPPLRAAAAPRPCGITTVLSPGAAGMCRGTPIPAFQWETSSLELGTSVLCQSSREHVQIHADEPSAYAAAPDRGANRRTPRPMLQPQLVLPE